MELNKENFVKIVDAVDEYFCGEQAQARATLGIEECATDDLMDAIISAIGDTLDPEHYAVADANTADYGDYLCSYLFGETHFQEECPTAEKLYDYVQAKYCEAPNDDSTQLKVNI